MIDYKQAEVMADKHIEGLERPADGYRFGRSDIVRVEDGWYFYYDVICELDIPKDQQPRFGNPFGFQINEVTGQLTTVSETEWVDLGLSFHPDLYDTAKYIGKA